MDLDIPDLVLKIIPVIITIAKVILDTMKPEEQTPEMQAAKALFDALLAYIEVVG